jgi:hypothetical protein
MLWLTNRKELRHFHLMTLGLTHDPTALIGATSTYPYNWMIVAGSTAQGKVIIIHHAFSVAGTTHHDPRIVGVTGNRKTSALKSFDPAMATKNLSPIWIPDDKGIWLCNCIHRPCISSQLRILAEVH